MFLLRKEPIRRRRFTYRFPTSAAFDRPRKREMLQGRLINLPVYFRQFDREPRLSNDRFHVSRFLVGDCFYPSPMTEMGRMQPFKTEKKTLIQCPSLPDSGESVRTRSIKALC